MPYILHKRSDVPNSVLQTLDLWPNTSQRRFPYETYGQTGYRTQPPTETCQLVNNAGVITFLAQAEGLAAWFLTNLNDGTGALATLTINIAAGNAGVGDTVLIDLTALGLGTITFIFQVAPPATPEQVQIGGSNLISATNLAARISAHPLVSAYFTGTPNVGIGGDVDITSTAVGTLYNGIPITTAGANLTPAGPTPTAGGADADALTAAEADQDVTDVLGLMNYGVPAGAAGALNLAAINGALTTGQIVAGDVASILDILAGRQYLVLAGVQIEAASAFAVVPAVGAAGGPNFDVNQGFRRIYDGGVLRISFNEGRLSEASGVNFIYGGVTGAAVAVYNNDGTLYTGI